MASVLASSVALAQNITAPIPAPRAAIDTTTQTDDVRFRDDGYDRMTVPVRVAETGPFRFLVDTGADRTAVSSQLAGQLKLPPGRVASLHTLGGRSTIPTVTVSSLQISRDRVKIEDAALLDREHIGADGILGTDTLRSQRILFDFEARTMSIVPSASRDTFADREAILVRARRKNGRLVISEARVNDSLATVVLDTGAQISVGNSALRKKLLGDRPVAQASLIRLVTVTGQPVTGECVYVDRLVLGGVTIRKLAIVFADAHTFKALHLDRKPAMLLGMNAIRAFKKISIDFAARKLRVVLPEESALDARFAAIGPRVRG
jgi:predicted aspartyl protease